MFFLKESFYFVGEGHVPKKDFLNVPFLRWFMCLRILCWNSLKTVNSEGRDSGSLNFESASSNVMCGRWYSEVFVEEKTCTSYIILVAF